MQKNNKRIAELQSRLPYGAKKIIAENTGVSQATVTRFFQGKVTKLHIYDSILEETIKLINEYKLRHFRMINKVLLD